MKQLTLIRHAEADQIIGQSDFERTLSAKGQLEAQSMGLWLRAQQCPFDRIFCSTAKRARQTAHLLFAEQGYHKNELTHDPLLYDFDINSVFHFIECLDDDFEHVVLVGHNPAFSDLSASLCKSLVTSLPTCAIVQLRLYISEWVEVKPDCADLIAFEYPGKQLTNG